MDDLVLMKSKDDLGSLMSAELQIVCPSGNSTLFDAVKKVRNNLLHGDKQYKAQRDLALIQAALVVLNEVYSCVEENLNYAAFIAEFRMDC